MRRMKKTIKTLIIVASVIATVAAVVLGCVFGIKDKPSSGSEFTAAQSAMFNDVLKQNQNSNSAISKIDADAFEDSGFKISRIKKLSVNCFTYVDELDNESTHLYTKTATGYSFKEVKPVDLAVGEEYENAKVTIMNDDFVALAYDHEQSSTTYRQLEILNVKGDELELVNKFSIVETLEGYYVNGEECSDFDFNYSENFYTITYTFGAGGSESYSVVVYEYDDEFITSAHTKTYDDVLSDETLLLFDNGYFVQLHGMQVAVGTFDSSSKTYKHETLDVAISGFENIAYYAGVILVESKIEVSGINITPTSVYVSGEANFYQYSYTAINTKTFEVVQLPLSENVAKFDILGLESENYFAILEQYVSDDNTLKEGGVMKYISANEMKVVLEYKASTTNPVVNVRGNTILTNDGLYSVKKGVVKTNVLKSVTVVAPTNSAKVFFAREDLYFRLFNLNGVVVSDKYFKSVASYANGNYLAFDIDDNVYYVNTENFIIKQIENFDTSNNNNKVLVSEGFGMYFVKDGAELKLCNHLGVEIDLEGDIYQYSFVPMSRSTLLKIYHKDASNNEYVTYYLNENYILPEENEEELEIEPNPISGYGAVLYDESKDLNWDNTKVGYVSSHEYDEYSKFKVYVDKGYAAFQGSFTCTKKSAAATWYMNYSTGSFTASTSGGWAQEVTVKSEGTNRNWSYVTDGGLDAYVRIFEDDAIWDDPVGHVSTAAIDSMSYWVYTIDLNANGGSGGDGSIYMLYKTGFYKEAACSTKITSITTKPTKTGYSFIGYYKDSNATTTQYIKDDGGLSMSNTFTTSSGLDIYAHYTPQTYTVTLDKNNGSGGVNSIKYVYNSDAFTHTDGSEITNNTITVPTRNGYTFGGYYRDSTQTTDASGLIKVATNYLASNANWVAKWTANNYTLTFKYGVYENPTNGNHAGVLKGRVSDVNFPEATINSAGTRFIITTKSFTGTGSSLVLGSNLFEFDSNNKTASNYVVISETYSFSYANFTTVNSLYNNASSTWSGYMLNTAKTTTTNGLVYAFDKWVIEKKNNNGTTYFVEFSTCSDAIYNFWSIAESGGITLHAAYKQKPLFIGAKYDETYYGSNKQNTGFDLTTGIGASDSVTTKFTAQAVDYIITAKNGLTNASMGTVNNNSYDKDVGLYGTAIISFGVNIDHYSLYKIEISNVGYYEGSTFATTTITMKYNGSAWTISSSAGTLHTSGQTFYVGNEYYDVRYNQFSYTTESGEGSHLLLDGTNRIYTRLILTITNHWFPTYKSGTSYLIDESHLYSTDAKYGIVVTPYARSVENFNDSVSIVGTAGYGSSLTLNAQKITSKTVFFYNNPTDSSDKYLKFTLSKTDKKYYYLIPDNMSESTTLEPVTDLSSLSASSITFATANESQIRRLIYVENNMAYYFGNSKSNNLTGSSSYITTELISTATTNYFDMNSKNLQIMAIEPEQARVQGSPNAHTITDLASVKYTRYELKSYLAAIEIAGAQTLKIDLTLDRDVTYDNGTKKYTYNNGMTFVPTGNPNTITLTNVSPVVGNSNRTFNYVGTNYTIYDGVQMTVNSREYVLYLTRDDSTNKTLYFLVSYGSANTTVNDIKLTFARFNYTVSFDSSLTSSDDLYSTGSTTTGATISQVATNGFATFAGTAFISQPSDTSIFKISPLAGYIIDSIYVEYTLGNGTDAASKKKVFEYKLNDNSFDNLYYTGGAFTYLLADMTYQLTYAVTNQQLSYRLANDATLTEDTFGIYSTGYSQNDWTTSDVSAFETIYLLIGGVYGNVNIVVKTKSYVEISFFDDGNALADSNSYTTTNSGHGTIENIDNLHIMVKNGANWVEVTSGLCDYVINNSTSNGVKRIVFVGKAKYFQNGIKMFATGATYSAYFTNGLLYMDIATEENHLLYEASKGINYKYSVNHLNVYEGRTSSGTTLNSTRLVYEDKLTYIEINPSNFISMFDNAKINDLYEYAKKYIVNFTVHKNEVQFNTNSYIFNGALTGADGNTTFETEKDDFNDAVSSRNVTGSGNVLIYTEKAADKTSTKNKNWLVIDGSTYSCYQLDYVHGSTTKSSSWFNDTILTNIDITANTFASVVNWQSLDKDTTKTSSVADNDGKKLSGYNVSYKYYCIPGYYLQYVTLDTIDNGVVYINIPTILKSGTDDIDVYEAAVLGSKKIYYKVEFLVDAYGPYYQIHLYYKDTTESNLNNNIKSIGLMSNDIVVNFYSMAYSFDIQYNDNINASKVSSTSSLTWNDGTTGIVGMTSQKQTNLYYDSFGTLNKYMTLDGYTFIGWGSQKYTTYDASGNLTAAIDRYDQNYTWNSSSSWFSVTEYFAASARAQLSALLGMTDVYSSDFYIKTSTSAYTNKTGYIVTDTGYKSNENYNFWSAYISHFAGSLGKYIANSAVEDEKPLKTIYLYAVWKPNTYALTFNVNDKNYENGSTVSTLNKRESSFNWKLNNDILSVDNTVGLSLSSGSGTTKTYYFYITFDTNNWYVVDADNASSMAMKKNSLSYLYEDSGDYLLDFIIDRYGYSWLGWTYNKVDNYLENTSTAPTYENNLVFASNYYYINYSASVRSDTPLTLNYTLYNLISQKNEAFDSVTSEFVYKGANSDYLNTICAGGYDQTKSYVYFYDYKKIDRKSQGLSAALSHTDKKCYIAEDYLNIDTFTYSYNDTTKSYFAYFDTSLSYQAYSISSNRLVLTRQFERFKYKYITLYSYWQTNEYEFKIDFRDDITYEDSFEPIGSDTVKDKDSYTFYNSNKAYFDDETLIERLLNFNPVRIGYDFLGWSFFYIKGQQNTVYEGDYLLNANLLSTYTVTIGQEPVTMIPLFIANDLRTKNRQSAISSSLVQEAYGDAEQHAHYTYIFAIWKAQTYTANISLNIEAEDLENLYEKDSSFVAAFYNKKVSDYDSYSALKFDFTKRNSTTYTEIVANINFVFTFDDYFANGYCMVGGQKFMLKDLFAVSTGYYLVGWLLDSGDEKSMILANTLQSAFKVQTETQISSSGYATLVNEVAGGSSAFGQYVGNDFEYSENILFDINFYNLLYSSKYKHNIASGEEFLTNNKVLLSDYDSAGESSNFGYLQSALGKHYFAVEYVTGTTGKSHYLYYKYKGVKYYVLLYVVSGSTSTVLDNDGEFLYYTIGQSKYIIDFDFNGKAYYTTSNYGERKELDIRIAVFKDKTDVIITDYNLMDYSQSAGVITYYFNDNGTQVQMSMNLVATREFTLYGHWIIKDEKIDIMNGNNTSWTYQDSNVYDENGNLVPPSQTSISNVGLAGYYAIQHHNNGVGIGEQTSGNDSYYKTGIDTVYDYYDDIDFTMIPYFNGRYVSDINIRFYVIENYNALTTADNFITWFKTTVYDIRIKFSWDNVNNKILVDRIVLYKDGATTGTNCLFNQTVEAGGVINISKLRANGSQISQLSILDDDSFEDTFFRIYPYGTYNERLDIQKVELKLSDVMTNVEVTARFSVQTFDIQFYNILDDNGNNIQIKNGSADMYETPYTITDFNNLKNAGNVSYPGYVASLKADRTNLATISTDAAINLSSFNVPYGYFIYGYRYDAAVTPMNEKIENVLVNINQKYGGYEYLYSYGFYNYGTTAVSIEGTIADANVSQGSPILGGNAFTQSIRLSLSFYTFAGWYESVEESGKIALRSYDSRESEYIKRNITLYAYYYSRNNPTSLQFYTWDDASTSYKLYTGNSDQYTLNADITDSPFVAGGDGILSEKDEKVFYVDDSGRAMININTKYGVDQVKFKDEQITITELSNDPNRTDDIDIMRKLLRSYWYYTMSYEALYYNDGGTKRYICYDLERNKFYYKNSSNATIYVDIYTADHEYYKMIDNGYYKDLVSEDMVYYNLDGAKMYVKILNSGAGDVDKYFEIKELTDVEILNYYGAGTNERKKYVQEADFRYYVDMMGQRYYFMPRVKEGISASCRTLYTDTRTIYQGSYTIETLDMNYIIYNGRYYPVQYISNDVNSGGSSYINPYDLECRVTLPVGNVNKTFYLNYEDGYLYETSGYIQKVQEITYKTYCPVNDNYAINSKYNEAESCWEIIGITINQLPSPNLDYWYGNAEYGFVGYIRFDDDEFDRLINPEGPINTRFMSRIDTLYKNESLTFRNNLKNAVAARIAAEYTEDMFLSSFMSAASYKMSSDGTYVEVVVVNIPCSFKDITFTDENGQVRKVSLSITAQHEFMLINKSMIIDTDIKAIPIFNPYVMRFNLNSQTFDSSSKVLTVKPRDMNVWHFDTAGGSTHIYMPVNGDYLNFVVLTKEQLTYFYDTLNTTVSTTKSSVLQSMIYQNKYKEIFVETANSDIVPITMNMSSYAEGEYFVLAFYNKSSTISSVVRVSDNLIHLDIKATGTSSMNLTTVEEIMAPGA